MREREGGGEPGLAGGGPLKVEGEFEGGTAAELFEFQIGHLGGLSQLVEGAEEGLSVLGGAGANDIGTAAEFHAFGGNGAVFGEGLGEAEQDGEDPLGIVVEWAVLAQVLLDAIELGDPGGDGGPALVPAPELELLQGESADEEGQDAGGGDAGPGEFSGGITIHPTAPGGDRRGEELGEHGRIFGGQAGEADE